MLLQLLYVLDWQSACEVLADPDVFLGSLPLSKIFHEATHTPIHVRNSERWVRRIEVKEYAVRDERRSDSCE